MTERRLRLSHLVVQPVLLWDDGDELAPGPEVNSVLLPLSGLMDFIKQMPSEIARLERQAEDNS